MDDWFVQVKGCGGDGERSILLCGKGYRQHPQLGEQMSGSSMGLLHYCTFRLEEQMMHRMSA